jgi:outer membrane protein assembly factor BamA
MKQSLYRFFSITVILILTLWSASGNPSALPACDTTSAKQTDLYDIFGRLLFPHSNFENKRAENPVGRGPFFSALPAMGYTLATGLTGVLTTSTSYYTDKETDKLSNTMVNAYYTVYNQYWFTETSNIFFEKSKLHIFSDTRVYKYPTQTYGLGPNTPSNPPLQIDYSYLRSYQYLYHELKPDLFLGIGYCLDRHWNIDVDSIDTKSLTEFKKNQPGTASTSSGVALAALYDSRKNSVNPMGGSFASVIYRSNMTLLGSDQNWSSLQIDLRHYFRFPENSHNVLAFWSYNDFTLSGNPPYLDLPSIGWDSYNNTGRGYVPGRYTGRNLVYLESEYRFGLTRNGLLGGVLFGNAESISRMPYQAGKVIIPGGGLGLRIKIHKLSDTNIAVDYGFGINGSNGFFFNIGEVF